MAEFRHLEYFVAAADQGTISAAATSLGVTQPAVSVGINSLERQLGTRLFRRGGRGLVLTTEGRTLLRSARRTLRLLEMAVTRASEADDALLGTIEVAMLQNTTDSMAAPLAHFVTEAPMVKLRIHDPISEEEAIEAVYRNQVQASFLLTPIAMVPRLQRRGLAGDLLSTSEIVVALPKADDTDMLPDPLPLTALPDYPVVTAPSRSWLREAVEGQLRDEGVRTHIGVSTEIRRTQVELVRSGAGMCWTTPNQVALASNPDSIISRRTIPRIAVALTALYREDGKSRALDSLLSCSRRYAGVMPGPRLGTDSTGHSD